MSSTVCSRVVSTSDGSTTLPLALLLRLVRCDEFPGCEATGDVGGGRDNEKNDEWRGGGGVGSGVDRVSGRRLQLGRYWEDLGERISFAMKGLGV